MGKRFKLALISVLTAVFCIVASPAIAHLNSSDRTIPIRSLDHQDPSIPPSAYMTAQGLVEQGRDRYNAGQFREAIRLLQQALDTYEAEGNTLQQAIALSNLSLAHQQLGNWTDARTTIETSLNLLAPITQNGTTRVMAQALTIQGKLQFSQGQFRDAVGTWKRAATYYRQTGDQGGVIQSQFNQTQALQSMGFYQKAIDQLTGIRDTLATEPDSPTKVATLHSLGNALRIAGILDPSPSSNTENKTDQKSDGNLEQSLPKPDATTILDQALAMAQTFELDQAIADIYISQGDVQRAQALRIQDPRFEVQRKAAIDAANALYQQATAQSPSPSTQIDARLRQFQLLITENDGAIPWEELQRLSTQIQLQLQALPPSRASIYQQVDLAQNLIQLKQKQMDVFDSLPPSVHLIQWNEIATLLAAANQQADSLGDARVQAQVLGTLGTVYIKAEREKETDDEKKTRQGEALYLTQQALQLAQIANADEITYQWYWQLARLRKQDNDREGAIAAYDEAIQSLKVLRKDLVAVDRNVQFSFRDTTEPIHRELVALLLAPNAASTPDDKQADLEKARQTIEDLQLAELDNFFRESCLNANDVNIDDVDSQAAVIYPIILSDRLEVILSLPPPTPQTTTRDSQTESSTAQSAMDDDTSNKPSRSLLNSTAVVSRQEIENTTRLTRSLMTLPKLNNQRNAQLKQYLTTLYGWLLEPFAEELQESGVETLVFVLDGALRSIPMAALFDGDQYLLETYSIALAPGIQLTEAAPSNVEELEVFLGGLSAIPEGEKIIFDPLPNVDEEFAQIQSTVASSQLLLNERFTERTIQDRISATSSPVVHLATHGKFGSQAENTFILAWDTRLNINDVSTLLQSSELNRRRPIELLVLSACETASGDSRASLGLAGMAVRSGARSTLASLWTVDDKSTSQTMAKFYKFWVKGENVTKAEALRQAQLSLLKDPDFNAPYYWAPFVLVGNWL